VTDTLSEGFEILHAGFMREGLTWEEAKAKATTVMNTALDRCHSERENKTPGSKVFYGVTASELKSFSDDIRLVELFRGEG